MSDPLLTASGRGARPLAPAPLRALFYLVQFTWCLPVNLAGLALFLRYAGRCPRERFRCAAVTHLPGRWGGFSLGVFLFLGGKESRELLKHEYGHTLQCLLLGPFYLLAVILPSTLWFHCLRTFRHRRRISYDALYCEAWATAWGRRWCDGPGSI